MSNKIDFNGQMINESDFYRCASKSDIADYNKMLSRHEREEKKEKHLAEKQQTKK